MNPYIPPKVTNPKTAKKIQLKSKIFAELFVKNGFYEIEWHKEDIPQIIAFLQSPQGVSILKKRQDYLTLIGNTAQWEKEKVFFSKENNVLIHPFPSQSRSVVSKSPYDPIKMQNQYYGFPKIENPKSEKWTPIDVNKIPLKVQDLLKKKSKMFQEQVKKKYASEQHRAYCHNESETPGKPIIHETTLVDPIPQNTFKNKTVNAFINEWNNYNAYIHQKIFNPKGNFLEQFETTWFSKCTDYINNLNDIQKDIVNTYTENATYIQDHLNKLSDDYTSYCPIEYVVYVSTKIAHQDRESFQQIFPDDFFEELSSIKNTISSPVYQNWYSAYKMFKKRKPDAYIRAIESRILDYFVRVISHVIANAPKIDRPMLLFRGSTREYFIKPNYIGFFKAEGFSSCSVDYDIVRKFQNNRNICCIQRIFVSPGTSMLYLPSVSLLPDQHEILLNAGSIFYVEKPRVLLRVHDNAFLVKKDRNEKKTAAPKILFESDICMNRTKKRYFSDVIHVK